VFLHAVFVPEENNIGAVDDGWNDAINKLVNERHLIGSFPDTGNESRMATLIHREQMKNRGEAALAYFGRIVAQGKESNASRLRDTAQGCGGVLGWCSICGARVTVVDFRWRALQRCS